MQLPIVEYPHTTLKQISTDVHSFDQELHTLLDNMYDTMKAKNGIGLAAIQVAVPKRVVILNLLNEDEEQVKEDLLEIINPVILTKEGTITYQEGCLSVPGFYEDIERFESISVTYQDRDGNEHTLEAKDLLSVAIQHEFDHLEGKLFIEKLPYAKRKKFEKGLKKAQRDAKKAL